MLDAINKIRQNKSLLRKKKLFKQGDKKGLLGRGNTTIELPQATPEEIEANRLDIFKRIRRRKVIERTAYITVTLMVVFFFLWLFLR